MMLISVTLIICPSGAHGNNTGTTNHKLYLPHIGHNSPVQVRNIRTWLSRGGIVQMSGEVVNTTHMPLSSVTIAVEFYPGTPQSLTTTGTTILPVVLPGQPNLFVINGPSSFNNDMPFEVMIQSWQEHSAFDYQAVTMASANICDVSGFFNRFCIELRNDHPRELRNVQVVVWSEQGTEYQRWSLPQASVLAPGQTVSVRVDPPFYSQRWPADTRAVAQGMQAP
jgi:hypothetical protein